MRKDTLATYGHYDFSFRSFFPTLVYAQTELKKDPHGKLLHERLLLDALHRFPSGLFQGRGH